MTVTTIHLLQMWFNILKNQNCFSLLKYRSFVIEIKVAVVIEIC